MAETHKHNNKQAQHSPPTPPGYKPLSEEQQQSTGALPSYVIGQVPVNNGQQHQPQQQPPVDGQGQPAPQMVYVARPLEPEKPVISEEVRQRHEDSKKRFPNLNLSEGEFVIKDVKRHVIGLVEIWGAVLVLVLMTLFFMAYMTSSNGILRTAGGIDPSAAGFGLLTIILLNALFILGGLIATKVYLANKFYLTNESVIQIIQHSLFSKREQTVSLGSVEDASFLQVGILQQVLNYGSIRLSTEGEETTYRLNKVDNPGAQIEVLNNAVESFKMGRPVDAHDN